VFQAFKTFNQCSQKAAALYIVPEPDPRKSEGFIAPSSAQRVIDAPRLTVLT
jgi:hypothetical protein